MNEWTISMLRRCADTETYSKIVHNMASTMFSLQTTALVWAMNIHSLRTRTPGARCLTRRPGPAMTMKPWNPYGATGTFHDVWCRQDAAVQFEDMEIATWDTKTCKSHQTAQQILLIVRLPDDLWSHKFNSFFSIQILLCSKGSLILEIFCVFMSTLVGWVIIAIDNLLCNRKICFNVFLWWKIMIWSIWHIQWSIPCLA